jgi:hypothetical protein
LQFSPAGAASNPIHIQLYSGGADITGCSDIGCHKIDARDIVAKHSGNPNACLKVNIGLDLNATPRVSAIFVDFVTVEENYSEEVQDVDEEGKPIEGSSKTVTKTREKIRQVETPISVTVDLPAMGYLTADQLKALKDREEKFTRQDTEAEVTRRTANDILTLCFSVRQALQGSHKDHATEEAKVKIIEVSRECEEWVEDNTPDYTLQECKQCYEKLASLWKPVDNSLKAAQAEALAAEQAAAVAAAAAAAEELRLQEEAQKQAEPNSDAEPKVKESSSPATEADVEMES